MLAVLIYPFSFYLTAAYTEGLFLTFAILCLLFARQGRWRLAAVMALLAGATRPTGVALICIGVAIQCYVAMRFLTGKLME
jgi:Gpi18-like mannosyltransferase